MLKKRFLIVGQGLAGSLLAYQLTNTYQQHITIAEMDTSHNNASKVSSGIINPVTGRRIVKTWLCDELVPYAWQFYSQLQQELACEFVSKTQVLRYFESIKEFNDFTIKTSEKAYKNYLQPVNNLQEDDFIINDFDCGLINNAILIKPRVLLERLKIWFEERNILQSKLLDYAEIKPTESGVSWQNQHFDYVIFCEGFRVLQNPFFNYLPFRPAKGEVLICKIPDFNSQYLIKKGIFIVPLKNDLYWVGATTKAKDADLNPTQNGIDWIKTKLEKCLKLNYEIVDTQVGIRPTTKDRRPIIGLHPNHKNIGVFNGMGTKGISLIPYFSKQLINHILEEVPLMNEVNLNRFNS